MRAPLAFAAAVTALLSSIAMGAMPAQAACKRFGFTVNDYGKEGPTHDAKELLDKHIAEWAGKQGIKDYKVGKKAVSCELFLNFVVFDEHTCTASANVCWGGDQSKVTSGTEAAAGAPPAPVRKAAAERPVHAGSHKAAHKLSAKTSETPPAAAADAAPDTSSPEAAAEAAARAAARDAASPTDTTMAPVDAVPTAAPDKSAAEAPPAAPAIQTAAPAKSEERLEKMAAPVETGALSRDAAPADMTPAAPAVSGEVASEKAKAAAAASAAAAAAERAAAAAETAANAAKEAAAAAIAASAAGRGAFVPPLGEAALTDKSKTSH
jgi:hypothetical protein